MAFVYRLQTPLGEGPYVGGTVRWFFREQSYIHGEDSLPYYVNNSADSWHPSPWEDGIAAHRDESYFCGFESFESFCDWFLYVPGQARTMAEEASLIGRHDGLKLFLFEVEERYISAGRRQVMFRRDRSDVVGDFTMHEVAELVR
jgi:hypothetical protein